MTPADASVLCGLCGLAVRAHRIAPGSPPRLLCPTEAAARQDAPKPGTAEGDKRYG